MGGRAEGGLSAYRRSNVHRFVGDQSSKPLNNVSHTLTLWGTGLDLTDFIDKRDFIADNDFMMRCDYLVQQSFYQVQL